MTFCAWRTASDKTWRTGNAKLPPGKDPDGSEGLLFALDCKPETWAKSYVELNIPLAAIKRIDAREALTAAIAKAINPEGDIDEIRSEARSIGYPLACCVMAIGDVAIMMSTTASRIRMRFILRITRCGLTRTARRGAKSD